MVLAITGIRWEIQESFHFYLKNRFYLQFNPHLLPVGTGGFLATAYMSIDGEMSQEKLDKMYQDFLTETNHL